MTDRFIMPLNLESFDDAILDEVRKFKDKLSDEELCKKYKDDPRIIEQHENIKRAKTDPVTEEDYLNKLESLFNGDIEDANSIEAYVKYGGIVLKPSEAEKLGFKTAKPKKEDQVKSKDKKKDSLNI